MNRHTTPEYSTLMRNKLAKVAIRLQQQALPSGVTPGLESMEQIVGESIKILSKFYKELSEPNFVPTNVIQGTAPDPDDYNSNFIEIGDDLEVIFSEFENLEGVVVGNFNYITSRLNRLNHKLKTVSSSLADFVLFSNWPSKDAIFFGDSFNNLDRVEFNTPLLNSDQAEVSSAEGIVTLPIDKSAQVILNITEVPVINSNSNGTAGNNQEANATLHGTVSDILDNNADTWFEYERVITTDDGVPLILDLTINIGSEKIINFVRINPNNFGTKTQVEIDAIDTSVDGEEFVSIKDDIPIAGYLTQDEENVFILASSTSKYAGQGLYSFTPRKAKYVHLTLRQTTPYIIATRAGIQKYRYAIGIRDVDIQAVPYKSKGEVVSTNYEISDEVKKVVLLTNQNPLAETVSNLAAITHYVSPDNGVTWHQIRPKESSGTAGTTQEVAELLDFNGIDTNTIVTSNPVNSLRYRAVLERYTDAFQNKNGELAQIVGSKTELHTPPTTSPMTIKLEETPIDGTLKLIDPNFGSRGIDEVQYRIGVGNAAKQIFNLPWKPLKKDYYKDTSSSPYYLSEIDPQTVYVGGEEWTRALDPSASTATDKYYALNFEAGTLEFGDSTHGLAPPSSSVISMILQEERLFPSKDSNHIAQLDYPTSNDKEQMTIQIVHPIEIVTEVLKKGGKKFQLKPDIEANVIPYLITFSDTTVFDPVKEVPFIDGSTELIGAGYWSTDYTNGVLYSYTRTGTNTDTTVTYYYHPRTTLTTDQWDFIDEDGGISNAVSISDNVFQRFEPEDPEDLPVSSRYINLGNLAIIPGSVVFDGTVSGVFDTELPFIDGRTELLGVTYVKEELAPITGIVGDTNVDIPFNMKVSTDASYSVDFTNQDIFSNPVVTKLLVLAVGDYYVDRGGTTGTITVRVDDNVSNPGYVSYYYVNPQIVLTGRYSINYKTGEIFLHNPTPSPCDITADYEYSDIRAKYHIAREVPSTDWTLDKSTNILSIKDREILKGMRTPQTQAGTAGASRFYQVSYDYVKASRADVSELEPYFSPVLKDYALRIITKSRLI